MYPQCQKKLFKTFFIYQVYLLVVHLPLTTLVWVLILWIQMARRNQLQELSHIFSMGDVPNNFGAIFLCKVTTDKCWGDLFVVFAYPSMLNNWKLFPLDLKYTHTFKNLSIFLHVVPAHISWVLKNILHIKTQNMNIISIHYRIYFITCILFVWMYWNAC